jgi:hypothetical protein
MVLIRMIGSDVHGYKDYLVFWLNLVCDYSMKLCVVFVNWFRILNDEGFLVVIV